MHNSTTVLHGLLQEIECAQLGMLINVIHNFLLAKLYETDRQFFKRIIIGTASYARLPKVPVALETLSEVIEAAEVCSSSPGTERASAAPLSNSVLIDVAASIKSVGTTDERFTASASCTPAHRVFASTSGDDIGACEQEESGTLRKPGGGARARCSSASEDSQEIASGRVCSEHHLNPRRPKIHIDRARLERQSAVAGTHYHARSRRVPAAITHEEGILTDASDDGTHDDTSYSTRSQSPAESDAEINA